MTWSVRRAGDVIVAAYARPPMSYFTDGAMEQLEGLVGEWARGDAAAIILTGGVDGRFVTHFDVDDILAGAAIPDGIAEAPTRSRRGQALTQAVAALPQPVIAAINGDAMGFGFELCLACDLRVAQRGDFRLGLPEVRLGLTPASSGLSRLTKLVGQARALDLILRAKVLTPQDALALGLVHELADAALPAAMAIAQEIAHLPRLAVTMAKKAIVQGADLPLSVALAFELESSFRLKQSPDLGAAMAQYVALPHADRRAWLEGVRATPNQ